MLLLLSLGLASCHRAPALGLAESVLTIHSVAAAAGIEVQPAQACVWMLGRSGLGMGLTMVMGHGMTVEECLRLGPP